MNKHLKHHYPAGFTIVELMIATVIFSLTLLLITVGLLRVTRSYYKGVTSDRTQQTARAIMDEITQAIQFSGGTVVATPVSPDPNGNSAANFCINGVRYSFLLNRKLVEGTPNTSRQEARYVLLSDNPSSGCTAGVPFDLTGSSYNPNISSLVNPQELLGPNMRLAKMSVTDRNNNLWQVDITVIYGDSDLLVDSTGKKIGEVGFDISSATCTGSAGSQFCARSALSTVVQKRVN
jgi:prepilin-type N-terminal cleavage/methylation domain-containing protein